MNGNAQTLRKRKKECYDKLKQEIKSLKTRHEKEIEKEQKENKRLMNLFDEQFDGWTNNHHKQSEEITTLKKSLTEIFDGFEERATNKMGYDKELKKHIITHRTIEEEVYQELKKRRMKGRHPPKAERSDVSEGGGRMKNEMQRM